MGLLDGLGLNLEDPEVRQGLLQAGIQMMAASGPSLKPVGFGQVLASGFQGYNDHFDNKLKREEAQLMNGMRKMQVQKGQLEMDAMKAAAERQARIRSRTMGLSGQPQQAGALPATGMPYSGEEAASAYRAAEAAGMTTYDPGKINQIMAQQRQGPSQESARSPQQIAPQMQTNSTRSHMDRLTHQANIYQEEGDFEGAMKLYEQAAKFMPKVKNWEKVNVGGKVLFAPYFEDGSTGQPVPYEVAEKLEFRNLGGKTVGVNPFTGASVAEFKNTMDPGQAAQIGLGYSRLNFDKAQADKPVFNNDLGGFVARPTKDSPGGNFIPLAGGAKAAPKTTEFQGKSAAFAARAKEADSVIRGLDGKYWPSAIAVKQGLGKVWGTAGALESGANMFLTDSGQKAEQAQRDFINAILRQESGAVISQEEFDNARKQYFAQPNDGEAVKQQKARNREIAIQGLANNAGRAAFTPNAPTVDFNSMGGKQGAGGAINFGDLK